MLCSTALVRVHGCLGVALTGHQRPIHLLFWFISTLELLDYQYLCILVGWHELLSAPHSGLVGFLGYFALSDFLIAHGGPQPNFWIFSFLTKGCQRKRSTAPPTDHSLVWNFETNVSAMNLRSSWAVSCMPCLITLLIWIYKFIWLKMTTTIRLHNCLNSQTFSLQACLYFLLISWKWFSLLPLTL